MGWEGLHCGQRGGADTMNSLGARKLDEGRWGKLEEGVSGRVRRGSRSICTWVITKCMK